MVVAVATREHIIVLAAPQRIVSVETRQIVRPPIPKHKIANTRANQRIIPIQGPHTIGIVLTPSRFEDGHIGRKRQVKIAAIGSAKGARIGNHIPEAGGGGIGGRAHFPREVVHDRPQGLLFIWIDPGVEEIPKIGVGIGVGIGVDIGAGGVGAGAGEGGS